VPAAGRPRRRDRAVVLAVLLGLLPLLKIVVDGVNDRVGLTTIGHLGANPIQEMVNRTGFWSLTLLTLTLACRPLTVLSRLTFPMRIRRALGLLAFSYGLLHFVVYVALDQAFDWGIIVEDVVKRKFMTIGFIALVLMAPLAATSTKRMVRRLGGTAWRRLHYLIYPAALAAEVHFVWRVRTAYTQPLIFATVLGGLLLLRVAIWLKGRNSSS
jgi:sulfoxide reductase heme-binding subunit YedZ